MATKYSIEPDAKLASLAKDMFHGDDEGARRWLKSPARQFNGESPVEHAQTEQGAREVEALIGRIRHGVLS
ncbi:putative toxin-antitoxin system antitoxin component (TIGR02293 family) [Marinobacter pelagius]|uniref:Putative toxin-antitoxin system antitoxin component (TIGR02293 family) n=1 Tax=Marinobacter pelagius TaxID=379482 RepID=A0A366GT14_9GAMM|nr:MbcA/ParS/Xre antitoxin family protein [Marinobacter pelagius]RBP30719.1 putative toxin-antitoxin system antitoxin component (TIGR02293 family) [Marinobacter pelagius]